VAILGYPEKRCGVLLVRTKFSCEFLSRERNVSFRQNNKKPETLPMTRSQEYRYLAERVRDRARQEVNLAAEWEQLARCYLSLAEYAERNEQADLFDDPIPPKPVR
jgi:hypothetical protein